MASAGRKRRGKRSPIWKFFTISRDSRYANCSSCESAISRGGSSTKTYNTTNLVNHLKTQHKDKHAEYLKLHEDAERLRESTMRDRPVGQRQMSMEESRDKGCVWSINDSRALVIHKRIGELIALDYQPFSIVEDEGCKNLLYSLEGPRYNIPSRRYVTETVMPKILAGIKLEVQKELVGEEHFSFTTDIWSSDNGHASLLSLTAHWVTSSFVRKSAVLHAEPIYESHTGAYLHGISQMKRFMSFCAIMVVTWYEP